VFLVVGLVLAVLWRRPLFFLLLVAADAAAEGISYGLREWIGRERPPLVYPEPKPLVGTPHSGSFPSGHTSTAFACATVLAWASPRLAWPAFLVAVAIAFSRVYVGVHWPLDILGGALLGTFVGLVLVFLGRRWREATALLTLSRVRPRSRPETPAD
jgi:undecaprenyl-diphosphatase